MVGLSEDFSIAPPPFDATTGLQSLKRELRALGLSERGALFERRGTVIAKASLEPQLGASTSPTAPATTINAARVQRPSRSSPQWQARSLRSSGDVRDFVADLKKQLALWGDRDD